MEGAAGAAVLARERARGICRDSGTEAASRPGRMRWIAALGYRALERACSLGGAWRGTVAVGSDPGTPADAAADRTSPTPWTRNLCDTRTTDLLPSKCTLRRTPARTEPRPWCRDRMPNHPFGTALGRTLDATLPAWQRLILPFTVSSADLERIKKSRPPSIGFITGLCGLDVPAAQSLLFSKGGNQCRQRLPGRHGRGPRNHLELSNHRRRTPRVGAGGRITVWTAPDLGCFALRITSEAQRPDGSFHLENVKQALRVTLKPSKNKKAPLRPTERTPRKTGKPVA